LQRRWLSIGIGREKADFMLTHRSHLNVYL
jgi:hypothetical protein